MAVSSKHLQNPNSTTRSGEESVEMTNFTAYHPFLPNHSPSTTSGSDHSASVSPPSFVHHENSGLSGHVHTTLFGDDDDLEDDSYENIAMESKFHATFHPHAHKKDQRSISQVNKLKATTAERRATHNAIERARRESLNGRFLELARALPTMSNVKRPSKSVIVNKSLEWIAESQMREYHLIKENNYLRSQVNELRSQLRLGPLPPPSFGNPLHMQAKDLYPYKTSSNYPLNPTIGHPVSSSMLHGNCSMPAPVRLSMNDSINLSMSGKLGTPAVPISSTDLGFNDHNKEAYVQPHDQAAGPFHPQQHHQRAQSFSNFGPNFGISNEEQQHPSSIHDHPSFGPSAPIESGTLSQTGQDSIKSFQTGFDPQQVIINEDGVSPSPGATAYYFSSDDDGTSSTDRKVTDSIGSTISGDQNVHKPSINLFGHPIGSEVVNVGKVINPSNHQLQAHTISNEPHNRGGHLDDSIIDLLHGQATTATNHSHLSGPDQAPTSGWLSEQASFGFNFTGPTSYIY